MIDGHKEIFNGEKYNVTIRKESRVHEELGRIKERADGRWNWWRKPSTFHRKRWMVEEHVQGTVDTSEEAIQELLKGWRPDLRPQSMLNFQEDEHAN